MPVQGSGVRTLREVSGPRPRPETPGDRILGPVRIPQASAPVPARDSLVACLGAVLELDVAALPGLADGTGDPLSPALATRVLGALGVGLAPVADPSAFSWPGPWIAHVRPPAPAPSRYVVMFGVPSGVVWDPTEDGAPVQPDWITEGYLVAAGDIALARPPRPPAPASTGWVQAIWVAPRAGEPATERPSAAALPGRGLDGDRHATGSGTFPSGVPGSALTLIEAEVCESFDPPLGPDDHRRNLVTRGIALNELVGHEFHVGAVRCRGMRLCEPCTVMQRYAGRPVLRPLVHRGGLRADILTAGEIRPGDEIAAA